MPKYGLVKPRNNCAIITFMNSAAFDEAYRRLNPAQKRAVDAIEGPVLVIAGPGSGKTQILSLRVANILLRTDVRPSNVLCLTFTDSAAANMRERLSRVIGHAAYKVGIETFHSFATDVIGRFPEFFYDGATFLPADELTQLEVLEKVFLDLPHDDPLRKELPDEGFVYLSAAKKAIGELKKAGLSPAEFAEVVEHNVEASEWIAACAAGVLDARVSMKQLQSFRDCAAKIRSHKGKRFPVEHVRPLCAVAADSLDRALADAAAEEATAPISAWKQRWIKKDDDGKLAWKDGLYGDKMRSLARVYAAYAEGMRREGYFDFDDMLLDVIAAAERSKRLRSELQEQYQYVLVDEFQDTNDAQLRLLRLISSSAANEGKPNVMAVGDDDQAIYKFQGAEVSNMLNFRTLFGDPDIIVLRDNYRSTQGILDVARRIIVKGSDRLERVIPELSKELVASGSLEGGGIFSRSFPSPAHEYAWIAKDAKRRIDAGEKPSEIAIISRSHRILEEMVPFLHERGVPVSYERQQNVFEEPHIRELILMATFALSLAEGKRPEADELLPVILSFGFWKLPRKAVWEVSTAAYRERKLWLDVMSSHPDERMRFAADFLLELGGAAAAEPLERVLDIMIGSHVSLRAADDDGDEPAAIERDPTGESPEALVSPFKSYYFDKQRFAAERVRYLTFLSSLRAFVEALREYRRGKRLTVRDLVSFVELHDKHGILVTDQSPFASSMDAVRLLSAHKAKGLEFDAVYVVSCQDEVWASRGRGSILPFPMNLPIAPAGDTDDDHLRLFYVALTRARKDLTLTSYEMNDKGKASLRLGFLADLPSEAPAKDGELPEAHHVLVSAWEAYNRPPFVYDEEALLKKRLEGYAMSVTHLNNFLDVTKGGPRVFLEQNLLLFPQAKVPSGSYGTAMHAAVERIYSHMRMEGKRPALGKVVEWFERALADERMGDADFKLYRAKGERALAAFYEAKKDSFDPAAIIEANFSGECVMVGAACLTGKIDKIEKGTDGLVVADWKTGTAALDWDGHTPYEKVKLHRYRRQLLFYKILVERSRRFEGAVVGKGMLEFLEPHKKRIVDLPLDISSDDVKRLEDLIEAVYARIMNLDFPDTTKYPPDAAGIVAFEDDLLSSI